MERQDELLRIALALRRGSAYFKSGWNINFLQAFIRDGRCVYCGRDVMNEFCVACGDHLLPKHRYAALAENVDNLVASCASCNVIKNNYDPSDENGEEIVFTDTVRQGLIDKSREVIMSRKNDYERGFRICEAAFRTAIEQYRQTQTVLP
jgi:hypothetical protein